MSSGLLSRTGQQAGGLAGWPNSAALAPPTPAHHADHGARQDVLDECGEEGLAAQVLVVLLSNVPANTRTQAGCKRLGVLCSAGKGMVVTNECN